MELTGKLVRDFIPDLKRADGEAVVVIHLTGDVLAHAECLKLVEEAEELKRAETEDEQLEELVDLAQLVEEFRKRLNVSPELLEYKIKEKLAAKGGYEKGCFLLEVR